MIANQERIARMAEAIVMNQGGLARSGLEAQQDARRQSMMGDAVRASTAILSQGID